MQKNPSKLLFAKNKNRDEKSEKIGLNSVNNHTITTNNLSPFN